MRNYEHIDIYLDNIDKDIYAQPGDLGHYNWAKDTIIRWGVPDEVNTVLDVGCGEGFCIDFFSALDITYTGITLRDEDIRNSNNRVRKMDMSFLDYPDDCFDMVFARHVLEHSPMPLLTLMEWYRVSKTYLMIILPAPEYWTVKGQNHYFVLPKNNWIVLFERSGWELVKEEDFTTSNPIFMEYYMRYIKDRDMVKWDKEEQIVEYRFLLRKK